MKYVLFRLTAALLNKGKPHTYSAKDYMAKWEDGTATGYRATTGQPFNYRKMYGILSLLDKLELITKVKVKKNKWHPVNELSIGCNNPYYKAWQKLIA